MDFLVISDIPTPWREPVFERVYEKLGGALRVVYFNDNERRRLWTFQKGRHPKTVLRALVLTPGGTERYANPGIVPLLLRLRPRVALVVASIKDPSAWAALATCRLIGTRVALIADTWLGRDRQIGAFQRLSRRVVYNAFGDAFVGASQKTLEMFRHYNPGIVDDQCFLSHLVADNAHFERRLAGRVVERPFDVMLAGRIVRGKNPLFFAEVCAGIKEKLGACRALVIGDGDVALKAAMRDTFEKYGVSYEFAGFVPHADLPDYYVQARLLLMPTSADCWGVVINEAMLSGAPVLTTGWTAAAGELVLHEQNGYVLPLEIQAWVSAATELLSDESKWQSFSQNARRSVAEFTYEKAADGILDSFAFLSAGPSARCP